MNPLKPKRSIIANKPILGFDPEEKGIEWEDSINTGANRKNRKDIVQEMDAAKTNRYEELLKQAKGEWGN